VPDFTKQIANIPWLLMDLNQFVPQLESVTLHRSDSSETLSLATLKNETKVQKIVPKYDRLTLIGLRNKTRLFVFDMQTGKLVNANENEFKTSKGKVVVINDKAFKIKGLDKYVLTKDIKSALRKFTSEGLITVLKDMYSCTTKILSVSRTILENTHDPNFTPIILDLMSLMLQHSSGTYNNWTPTYFLGFIARVFSIYSRVKLFISQSLDGILFSLAMIGFPAKLTSTLKNLSLLTNKKIGDHPNLILDVITEISNFLMSFIDECSWIPMCIKDIVRKIFVIGTKQKYLYDMRTQINKWDKDKRCMLDSEFRNNIKVMRELIENDSTFIDYLRSSTSTKLVYDKFVRMCKAADSYERCSRVEPVCVVLEGPPGFMKTIAAVKVVELLGRSTYTHIVKGTEDGRDFYDSYNEEEVFVMDDVGQQSISQWRTMINYVSSLKMPLDCASAELKDTKYFNSKIVICTTNSFSELHGLSKSDGIADIEALWRRGHVIKFLSKTHCKYMRYDIYERSFVSKLPPGLKSSIPLEMKGSHDDIVPWITALTEILENHYHNLYETVTLTPSQKEIYRETADYYKFLDAESFLSDILSENLLSMFSDFMSFCMDTLTDLMYKTITDVRVSAGLLLVFSTFYGIYCFCKQDTKDDVFEVTNSWRKAILSKNLKPMITHGNVILSAENGTTSTVLEAIKKQTCIISMYKNGREDNCHCIVSGHKAVLPYHTVVNAEKVCSIYLTDQDWEHRRKALDLVPFTVEFFDKTSDICVISFPTKFLTPFKNYSHFFRYRSDRAYNNLHLVTSVGIVPLKGSVVANESSVKYTSPLGEHVVERPLLYSISSPGLCGSMLVDSQYGVIGMHVAGDGETGVSMIFSQRNLSNIYEYLKDDTKFNVNFEIKQVKESNFSGMRIKTDYYHEPPHKSSIVPSKLHGIYPITKEPANMKGMGDNTLVERAKRVHIPVTKVPEEELEFINQYLDTLITPFEPISDYQVIKGDDMLSGINNKSVNGYAWPGNKEDYFNFETGELTPVMKHRIEAFEIEFDAGKIDLSDILQYHTMKDELRLLHKVNKPRTFGVDTVLCQYYLKKYLGGLFMNIANNKWHNYVAIGINPYKDWQQIYDELVKCKYVWDGDVGEWDASLSSEIQHAVNEQVLKKFLGSVKEKAKLEFFLELSIRSWVLMKDKVYLKTHGILSGMWITNLFNSIINRCYTAGLYARMSYREGQRPIVMDFVHNFVDFVQGDDKLCGVKPGLLVQIDGKDMANYFESLGMTYTDGKKRKVTQGSMSLGEVSFLKRKFIYHKRLGRVMGPLDPETLTNMVMWYDNSKDEREVMDGKLNVFQREMFLHEDQYQSEMSYMQQQLKERRVPYNLLTEEYMVDMYTLHSDWFYKQTAELLNKNF